MYVLGYFELAQGICQSVTETECSQIAFERNLRYINDLYNDYNPPGCFIHYGHAPDTMWFNLANIDYECESKKTCVCESKIE